MGASEKAIASDGESRPGYPQFDGPDPHLARQGRELAARPGQLGLSAATRTVLKVRSAGSGRTIPALTPLRR